ncbi:hypothetical protein [Methylobacterium frigidaeris]|uniref:hypothetical protein n=1 Tax=Methylobacterium frigidaeris TaxID=2038277 RepID=UPI0010543B3F|nr:hypothetical protein [Methylobacterium frigidaeris]
MDNLQAGRSPPLLQDAISLRRVLDELRAQHSLDAATLARIITQIFIVDLDLLAEELRAIEHEDQRAPRASAISAAGN